MKKMALAAALAAALIPAFAAGNGGHGGGGPVGNGYHGFCTGQCAPTQTNHKAKPDRKLYSKGGK